MTAPAEPPTEPPPPPDGLPPPPTGPPERPFVRDDFDVPTPPRTGDFVLTPVGPEHNEADFDAWTSSIPHIRATPGFAGRPWPEPGMTLEQNLGDLVAHAEDFAARRGFTYTVLDPASGGVIGCVYLYPSARADRDADVRSWVRASRADLDGPLYDRVRRWLAAAWPFRRVDYAPRPPATG